MVSINKPDCLKYKLTSKKIELYWTRHWWEIPYPNFRNFCIAFKYKRSGAARRLAGRCMLPDKENPNTLIQAI
jgi:hypothetical protein